MAEVKTFFLNLFLIYDVNVLNVKADPHSSVICAQRRYLMFEKQSIAFYLPNISRGVCIVDIKRHEGVKQYSKISQTFIFLIIPISHLHVVTKYIHFNSSPNYAHVRLFCLFHPIKSVLSEIVCFMHNQITDVFNIVINVL